MFAVFTRTHTMTYPHTFAAFDAAFHALEGAMLGKNHSRALERASFDFERARDLYNEKADNFADAMHPSDIADQIENLNFHRYKVEGWKASDTTGAEYLGPLEIEKPNGETEIFEILATPERLIFGGATNSGFLESGFMPLHYDETREDALCALADDLAALCRDRSHNRIYHNERI